jgi:prophage regulatory protein
MSVDMPEPPVRFLRLPEVLDRVGVTAVTIWRWEQQGLFPPRRKIGPRLVGWVESEIVAWCAERPSNSSGDQR